MPTLWGGSYQYGLYKGQRFCGKNAELAGCPALRVFFCLFILSQAFFVGWGRSDQPGSEYLTTPPRLKQLRVDVMNQTQCAERVAKLVPKPGIGITVQEYFRIYENNVMCVISKNASGCFGDSGGPLVCKENGH